MPIEIVVACDQNGGIGKEGSIPWLLPEDMRRFRTLTTWGIEDPQSEAPQTVPTGHSKCSVIMGRTTWESLPDKFRPLPNRNNIIISSTMEPSKEAWVVRSLEEALQVGATLSRRTFVIGGERVYRDALRLPGEKIVHMTRLFISCGCDRFFLADAKNVSSNNILYSGQNGDIKYTFNKYVVG